MTLQEEIDAVITDAEGLVEVVIALPDGTWLYEVNAWEPIEAASLYKLAIMIELFRAREAGELTFDDELVLTPGFFNEEDSVFWEGDISAVVTIETLLTTMITVSSNVAAAALLAHVGNDNVNLTMASLGLGSTEIRWAPDVAPQDPTPGSDESSPEESGEDPADEEPSLEGAATIRDLLTIGAGLAPFSVRADEALNVTTAADMAALYVMLLNGQVVSEVASREMLALLTNQQINDRLPAYLPDGVVVTHKTGNLDGLVHDAGVVYALAGPVVVVVLTEDLDEGIANDIIARIARLAYDAMS